MNYKILDASKCGECEHYVVINVKYNYNAPEEVIFGCNSKVCVERCHCENCRYAIYDSVPYGMGSCSYLSGCQREDDMTDEQIEQSENGYCDLWEEGGCDYEI